MEGLPRDVLVALIASAIAGFFGWTGGRFFRFLSKKWAQRSKESATKDRETIERLIVSNVARRRHFENEVRDYFVMTIMFVLTPILMVGDLIKNDSNYALLIGAWSLFLYGLVSGFRVARRQRQSYEADKVLTEKERIGQG